MAKKRSLYYLNRAAAASDSSKRAEIPRDSRRSGMNPPDARSAVQERECVRRAQQGDAMAFRRLVDSYDRRLLYFVLRFLPDADGALDVLQDVWLTLFRRLPQLRA